MRIYATKDLRQLRLQKGYSATELAELIGISRQALSQIELGKNGISPAGAKKASKLLGVKFEEIFTIVERGITNG